MAITVKVPFVLRWCTGGEATVPASGSTVGEVWADLQQAYPELTWRLSLEQRPRSFRARVCVAGQRAEHPVCAEGPVSDGSLLEIHVLPGIPGRGRPSRPGAYDGLAHDRAAELSSS